MLMVTELLLLLRGMQAAHASLEEVSWCSWLSTSSSPGKSLPANRQMVGYLTG